MRDLAANPWHIASVGGDRAAPVNHQSMMHVCVDIRARSRELLRVLECGRDRRSRIVLDAARRERRFVLGL